MVQMQKSTDVRKDWSAVVDNAVRIKPQLFTRTRDNLFMSDFRFIEDLLVGCSYTATRIDEEDGSVTLALNEIDLVENGKDEMDAREKLAKAIYEYAEDYYNDFSYWSSAPNRKAHLPYVFKALSIGDVQKIGESITCLAGKN